jgi:hypothetical protein
MKRCLVLLAGLFAGLAFTAATAAAQDSTYTLQFTPTPTTIYVGEFTNLQGGVVADPNLGEDLSGYSVEIAVYDEETCTSDGAVVGHLTTNSQGYYGGSIRLWAVRTYYFDATVVSGDLAGLNSECVGVTVRLPGQTTAGEEAATGETPPVVSEPPHDGSSFLCWNREMVNPVAYDDPVADEMWKTGKYLEPQAILGNVVDGTNIGAYHLVCNAPATMKITDTGIGGSGEVYNALALDAYHHAHQGDNDLNVYHIWK